MFKLISTAILAFGLIASFPAFAFYVLTCPNIDDIKISDTKINSYLKSTGKIMRTWGGFDVGYYDGWGTAQTKKIGQFKFIFSSDNTPFYHQIQCMYGDISENNAVTVQTWFTTVIPYQCTVKNVRTQLVCVPTFGS